MAKKIQLGAYVAKINHLILHEVTRRKDGESFKQNLRDTENNLDGITGEFADSLGGLFTKSNLNLGEFGVDGDPTVQPVFEQFLNTYYSQLDLTCNDFVELTKKMAKRFAVMIEIGGKQNVKGGLFVFYEYELHNKLWLAIAILQRSDAYHADNKDLELEASEVIDIERLHLGATVNLTDWSQGQSKRYIKFKAGLAKDLRDYFEEYIGCQRDKSIAKTETKALKAAISGYASDVLSLTSDKQQEKLDLAHTFIKEKQDNDEEVELSCLAKHLFPENDESFLTYTKKNHDLGETVSIDNSGLRSFRRITGKNKDVSISFNRELLGKTVHYSNGKLTFDLLPDKLKEAIEEEL